MAIRDINELRNTFPGHFIDRDPLTPVDYLRIPTDEPEGLTARDPDFSLQSEDIEKFLAEEPLDQPMEPISPSILDVFGGHAGSPVWDPNRGNPRDSVGRKNSAVELLAFYLPFHCYPDWWGIYIFPEGIQAIRRELSPFFTTHGIAPIDQVRFAKALLYHHEYYHHCIESFGTRLETILNQPCYLQGFCIQYRATFGTAQCLEETCANSYAREKMVGLGFRFGLSRSIVREALNDWFSGQPDGYAEAAQTDLHWKRDVRWALFEDYLANSPGGNPIRLSSGGGNGSWSNSRRPHPAPVASAAWSIASGMDRGIGDIRSRFAYMIPKHSPFYQRLPTDLKTCVKARNFKRKLQQHGIAEPKRQGGSHEIWSPPGSNLSVPIPRHDGVDIPKGTMRSILRQLGCKMSIEQFLAAQ
jgi:predicted RNA binding protein YcfA (HicA-like mRNA interferase family)